MTRTLVLPLFLLLLLGCGGEAGLAGSAPRPVDDGGVWCAAASGPPSVSLIRDDERHAPVQDGDTYTIERRIQGDVTIFAPLAFRGLDGGTRVEDFSIVFTDDTGEERGARRADGFMLPCEDDGEVAGHWYEVFFGNPGIPASTYDGLMGTLAVEFTLGDDQIGDAVSVMLRAE